MTGRARCDDLAGPAAVVVLALDQAQRQLPAPPSGSGPRPATDRDCETAQIQRIHPQSCDESRMPHHVIANDRCNGSRKSSLLTYAQSEDETPRWASSIVAMRTLILVCTTLAARYMREDEAARLRSRAEQETQSAGSSTVHELHSINAAAMGGADAGRTCVVPSPLLRSAR